MSWLNALMDSKPILTIFGSNIPTLESIEIHEIIMSRDGPSLTIRFDLNSFPQPAPRKWVERSDNCVQVTLLLIGVTSVRLNGWALSIVTDIDLKKTPNGIILKAESKNVSVEVAADFATIQKISAHHCTSKVKSV